MDCDAGKLDGKGFESCDVEWDGSFAEDGGIVMLKYLKVFEEG